MVRFPSDACESASQPLGSAFVALASQETLLRGAERPPWLRPLSHPPAQQKVLGSLSLVDS